MKERRGIIIALCAFVLLCVICVWRNLLPIIEALTFPDMTASSMSVEIKPAAVVVSGRVPDLKTKAEILATAGVLFLPRKVEDKMEVSVMARIPRWQAVSKPLLGMIAATVDNGRLKLNDDTVAIWGLVASEAVRTTMMLGVKTACLGQVVLDSLTVLPNDPIRDTENEIAGIVAKSPIEFESASAVLTAKGKSTLDKLAPLIMKANAHVEIQGHTDSTGNPDKNRVLSLNRAIAVRSYLASRKIRFDRMTAQGFGSSAPKFVGAESFRNRRVEFKFQKGH